MSPARPQQLGVVVGGLPLVSRHRRCHGICVPSGQRTSLNSVSMLLPSRSSALTAAAGLRHPQSPCSEEVAEPP